MLKKENNVPIKNFLFKSLFKIKDILWHNKPTWPYRKLINNFSDYKEMQNLSIESFQKNLLDDWTLVNLTGSKNNIQEAFINNLICVKKHWHDYYPCNILYADPDIFILKKLKIFNEYENFIIFSDSASLRYFPSTLTREFWDQIDKDIEQWNYDVYDHEQQIFQKKTISPYKSIMILDQFDKDKDCRDTNEFKQISYKYKAVHLCGNITIKEKIKIMKNIKINCFSI